MILNLSHRIETISKRHDLQNKQPKEIPSDIEVAGNFENQTDKVINSDPDTILCLQLDIQVTRRRLFRLLQDFIFLFTAYLITG